MFLAARSRCKIWETEQSKFDVHVDINLYLKAIGQQHYNKTYSYIRVNKSKVFLKMKKKMIWWSAIFLTHSVISTNIHVFGCNAHFFLEIKSAKWRHVRGYTLHGICISKLEFIHWSIVLVWMYNNFLMGTRDTFLKLRVPCYL